MKERSDVSRLEPDEADIVTYVRQLFQKNRVEQGVFDRLQQRHGMQWLLEMTTAVGYYGMLAGVINAFELPAPPDGDPLPVRA